MHTIYRITDLFQQAGLEPLTAMRTTAWICAAASVALSAIIYLLLRRFIEPVVDSIAKKTPTKVDDILLRHAFLKWVWWLLALWVLQYTLPVSLLIAYPRWSSLVSTVDDVIIIALSTKLAVELLKGIFLLIFDSERVDQEAARLREAHENEMEYVYTPSHSLKGLEQMLTVVIVCVGVVLMISVLLGKNPVIIISGLGAGAAVLMLVFRDSILGVVAGIQLTVNKMLQPGDWIIAPKYGANGRVQEVTLATVKVLNWDNTIVTIPPYNLISDSFQNWRKMEESGARRVMRTFNIDMKSVRYLTPDELLSSLQEPWMKGVDPQERQINLTLFRRWLEYYISQQPTLRPNMLWMVRELDPTPQGLPVQIYFFTTETSWAAYEAVQAHVMDHVLADIGRFGLSVYQYPSHL